jgi:hypothetical protein
MICYRILPFFMEAAMKGVRRLIVGTLALLATGALPAAAAAQDYECTTVTTTTQHFTTYSDGHFEITVTVEAVRTCRPI